MLIISRRVGESVDIEGGIRITVNEVGSNSVRLSIIAPPEVLILRSELNDKKEPAAPPET